MEKTFTAVPGAFLPPPGGTTTASKNPRVPIPHGRPPVGDRRWKVTSAVGSYKTHPPKPKTSPRCMLDLYKAVLSPPWGCARHPWAAGVPSYNWRGALQLASLLAQAGVAARSSGCDLDPKQLLLHACCARTAKCGSHRSRSHRALEGSLVFLDLQHWPSGPSASASDPAATTPAPGPATRPPPCMYVPCLRICRTSWPDPDLSPPTAQ